MGKCKFQNEWLRRKDSSGVVISVWGEKRGDGLLFCRFCENVISTAKGFCTISQHYETDRHKKACLQMKDSNQLHFATTSYDAECDTSLIRLYSVKDSAYTAELIFLMKMIQGNIPTNFCQDIAQVFKTMFPTPEAIPEGFSLNPTKARYLISDCLGPYFRKKLLADVGSSYYSLLFDETTNSAGAKELQTAVRYWSESQGTVYTCHLETFFIGHANAETLREKLLAALNNAGLALAKMLMLGSDGPQVNKKVFLLLNEDVKAARGQGLVNVGFCNLHMVHNAFQKGLEELGSDASELIICIYHFFKDWPSRWEDFATILDKMNLPNLNFIKHVNSRWLTIEPAAHRLLHHWDAVIEYFLKFVPMKQSKMLKTNAYKRILQFLKKKSIKAELKFITISASLFTEFTGLYQRSDPLIHLLYEHINKLLIGLVGRSCKKGAVKAFKEDPTEEIFNAKNLLKSSAIILGDEMLSMIAHLTAAEKDEFILLIRNHYIAAGKYVLTNMTKSLKKFNCLNPKSSKKPKSFKLLASSLPFVPINQEKLMDEVVLYNLETVINEEQADKYWAQLQKFKTVEGNLKYPNIYMLVKASLSLSHGNADVERGFSKSARILTEDRSSMSVRSLNAILNTADGLKLMGNKPHLVPISKELVESARVAYKSYNDYLLKEKEAAEQKEKEKMEAEELAEIEKEKKRILAENQKDFVHLRSQLQAARGSEDIQTSAVDELVQEANSKLKKALQKNDLVAAQVAQAMLEGAVKNCGARKEKRKAVVSLERKIDKKRELITNFFSKKT